MASPKLGARMMSRLAAVSFALCAGCYATTPHKAELATAAPSQADCAKTVAGVLERSGFQQLPTPPNWSMFFTARMAGPYSSFLRSGSGVGVNVSQAQAGAGAGTCHVTIEALSPDVNCPEMHQPLVCGPGNNIWTNAIVGGPQGLPQPSRDGPPAMREPCPVVPPLSCELSYAPGADNDAAVDELAKRVQAALGPGARVN